VPTVPKNALFAGVSGTRTSTPSGAFLSCGSDEADKEMRVGDRGDFERHVLPAGANEAAAAGGGAPGLAGGATWLLFLLLS
jgi:hypothetical protein